MKLVPEDVLNCSECLLYKVFLHSYPKTLYYMATRVRPYINVTLLFGFKYYPYSGLCWTVFEQDTLKPSACESRVQFLHIDCFVINHVSVVLLTVHPLSTSKPGNRWKSNVLLKYRVSPDAARVIKDPPPRVPFPYQNNPPVIHVILLPAS